MGQCKKCTTRFDECVGCALPVYCTDCDACLSCTHQNFRAPERIHVPAQSTMSGREGNPEWKLGGKFALSFNDQRSLGNLGKARVPGGPKTRRKPKGPHDYYKELGP